MTMTNTDWRRIDSRDLVEELAELEGRDDKDNDELDRETAIRALFAEINGYSGDSVTDGIFLIADDDFEEYARELADDMGAVRGDGSWPTYCIDWAWAARELQQDYTTVEFDGITYWYR